MNDLISRQAAIDKISERQRKLIYCFGFENDMVKMMNIAKSIITALPPAQPEIIHCRDCKYHSHDADYGRDWCNRMSGVFRVKPDDFCSYAERRTDGN